MAKKKMLTAPGWNRMDYTLYGIHQKLKDVPPAERERVVSAEYTRLRDIAQKRIKRLGASEFKTSREYKEHAAGFPKIRDMKNTAEIERNLEQVFNFLAASKSTVTGQRKAIERSLQTFKERGLEGIAKNEFELKQFGKFMEAARAKYGAKQYDSEGFVKFYHDLKEKNISPTQVKRNFTEWMKNKPKLEEMPRYANKRPVSAVRALKDITTDAHSKAIPGAAVAKVKGIASSK